MSLTHQIKRGVLWVAVSTVSVRLLSFAATFVLAKRLMPEDFGLVAGAYLAIDALQLFEEMGFGSALIYRQREVEEAADTTFIIILCTSLLSYAIAYAAAPWVAQIAKQPDPRIAAVLRVLALNLVVGSMGRVPLVLLAKELDFRRRLVPDVLPNFVYALTAVLLAVAGFRVWSIVYARLASTLLRVILAWWVTGWRPRWRFVPRLARELFDYGKHIVASQILIFGITNIDDGFVLRMRGLAAEGVYDLAYRTSNMPATQITGLVNQVMFPALARLQDDPDTFRRTYFQALRYVSLLAIPVAVGTMLFAPDIIATIDAEKWAGAVLPLQLLGIYGLLRAVAANMGNVFKSGGRPKWLTGIALWRLTTMALLLYPVTRTWGIDGVAGLSAAVAIVDFFISGTLANRVIHSSWADYGRVLLPILGCSVVAGALGWAVPQLTALETGALVLLLGGGAMIVAYAALSWLTQPDLRDQVRRLMRRLAARRRSAPSGQRSWGAREQRRQGEGETRRGGEVSLSPCPLVSLSQMRVIIAAPAQLNPYPVLFHQAVQQADPALDCALWRWGLSWRKLLSPQRPHVLHLHWLELLYRHDAPWRTRLFHWTNTMLAIGAARLLGVKVVYTVHNVWQHEPQGRVLYRLASRFVLRIADGVHVHSEPAREELLRSFRCRGPVVVIPHGNYVTWYANECSRQAARQRLGLPPDAFVYLSLGQVRPYKGVEELLQAFADLAGQELVLLIAGRAQPPEYGQQVRALAAGDRRVRLHLDYVPDDEVQVFMNGADVAVLPYRQTTTSGAAILALSFGLPVVAPALGPFPPLLGQGAGLLYDPQPPQALAEALRAARQMDLAAARRSAQEMARSLDWGPIGRQFAALYRQITEV
ncbi:MAG: oligosaccharide flippase family protein [Chloroflexi bacterium]|nr:oligosaccharide flippase family protein [Chloroflexota bacterium]